MHALLIPFGTAGDVHPFIGVAIALKRRGHRVTVFTDRAFEEVVCNNGSNLNASTDRQEYADLLQHPDLWHPTRSYPLIFKNLVAPKIKPVYDFIDRRHTAGQTVVVAANLALGARVACDKLDIPLVSMYVSPMCFRSYLHPPPFPGRIYSLGGHAGGLARSSPSRIGEWIGCWVQLLIAFASNWVCRALRRS